MTTADLQGVTYPRGFSATGVSCGIKQSSRRDLAVLYADSECNATGMFTTNLVRAAPVVITQQKLESGRLQGLVINSGNANACTGQQGLDDARRMIELCAAGRSLDPRLVGVCSTGIIGHVLPMDRIASGIREAQRAADPRGGPEAARAIMTTDTVPKMAQRELELDGEPVRIGGMAKGAGMIHPNMATMISVITTDASVESDPLGEAFRHCVERSLNSITIDGHTSTNDTALVMASGHARASTIRGGTDAYRTFRDGLLEVTLELARKLVADGEGCGTFVEVRVLGARSFLTPRRVGRTIASSTLFKTAIFGQDPNWGRILSAAGYSGVRFDPEKVDVHIGDVCVARGGSCTEFDLRRAEEHLAGDEVHVSVDLNRGGEGATVWTCDLTHEYIDINSMYTT